MREVEITWGPNRDLVARLSESGARFFVAGGSATRFHAPERREPGDLDLLVEPSAEMLAKLRRIATRALVDRRGFAHRTLRTRPWTLARISHQSATAATRTPTRCAVW